MSLGLNCSQKSSVNIALARCRTENNRSTVVSGRSWDKTLVQVDVNVFNTVDLTWFKLLVKLFSQHWPDVGRIIGAQLLNTSRMGGPFIKTGHTCLMSIC